MSPEFRYHVASLAAVFFALGIGILIGTTFVGTRIVDRQTGLIGRLEARVDTLRRESRERDQTEAALRLAQPTLVGGVLEGVPVTVIDAGEVPAAVASAEQALKAAGAVVDRVVLPLAAWQAEADPVGAAERVATALVVGQDLSALASAGLLDGKQGKPTRHFVLVGGLVRRPAGQDDALESVRRRDPAVVRAIRERGGFVVATEALGADVSTIGGTRAEGISTVDCVDRPVGAVALPLALRAAARGDAPLAYGMREDADQPIPALQP